jgi:hypothetical protein
VAQLGDRLVSFGLRLGLPLSLLSVVVGSGVVVITLSAIVFLWSICIWIDATPSAHWLVRHPWSENSCGKILSLGVVAQKNCQQRNYTNTLIFPHLGPVWLEVLKFNKHDITFVLFDKKFPILD